ncbi:MAG TPA: PAS domain-containing protein [Rhodospirillaceae bacterium]|nr:PAS domain-containing protein [Rhodospirillaceae bacterium]
MLADPVHIGRRLLPVVAVLSLPTVVVLLVLATQGWLDVGPALAGCAVTVSLLAVALRPTLRELAEIARYARVLGRGEPPPQPQPITGTGSDMMVALRQVVRAWHDQRDELSAALKFHEALFDDLPSPIFLIDAQRRVVRCNRAAEEIFGRQPPGRDLTGSLRVPDLLETLDRVLAEGSGDEVEFSQPSPDDRQFRAMIRRLASPGADGTVAILALHDISAMKRIEQMRADFVANASHELRTPLAALLGFIETLRGPARDDAEARDRFLAIMQEQGERMSRLIADLLTLSRIELQEYARPEGHADIAAVLKRVVSSQQLAAVQRRMELVLDIAEPLPPLYGQEEDLEQIFQNLVDNALKYGRDGTSVTISARPAEPQSLDGRPMVAVAVIDQGEGIARQHLPRLTERFFRVDTARSRRLGGTGLGLAIVKHLVNRHRGQLSIDSREGVGSSFTVSLPAKIN